jgi:tripartite-type tricarboxylate transporter receptor subunit TctC
METGYNGRPRDAWRLLPPRLPYRLLWSAPVAWIVAFSSPAVSAAEFPHRPVRIVVPFPVSGPTDIRGTSRMTRTYKLIAEHAPPAISDKLARLVARAIRADSRHGAILERQPGGITTRGAAAVARATADGHTLLLASNATIVINPQYLTDVGYEPARDFVLVAPLVTMPFVLMVNSSVPVDTPRELVAWLKVRPGEVNYGSSGGGSTAHLAAEFFRRMTGVDVVHVSYNGGLAALNGVALNHISLMFAALPLALPYVTSEHLRALGVAGSRRTTSLPDLPTLAESGVGELDLEGWFAIFAPARSPRNAVAWLAERIVPAIDDPAIQRRLVAVGLEPVTGQRAQFATRIHTETARWAPVLRTSRPGAPEPAS